MIPVPRHARQRRKDRLNINIVPEDALTPQVRLPYLHWLFGEDGTDCYTTRLLRDDYIDEHGHAEDGKVETIIMGEVTDWIESRHCDAFWAPRTRQPRKVLPTVSQVLRQHENIRHFATPPTSGHEAFKSLLHAIALQLLASCYTLLPASGAANLPLVQQRRHPERVTALHLQSQYQYEPAAGHHARAPSEVASWPGLFAELKPEDTLAEQVSRKRRLKCSNGYTPRFAAIGWTDGSSPSGTHHARDESNSTANSTSSSEPGFLSRLISPASTPKNSRRKNNTMFTSRLSPMKKKQGTSNPGRADPPKAPRNPSKPFQSLTSRAVQRIPSALRLRRTQSAPRIAVEGDAPAEDPSKSRRHSSNPSKGSTLTYPFEIPQIRRISATPAASKHRKSVSHAVRACGRGDMILTRDYGQEDSVDSFVQPLHDQGNLLTVPSQPEQDVSQSPPADYFLPIQSGPRSQDSQRDYFNSVHTARDIDDEDDSLAAGNNLTDQREDAGPRIQDSPVLQRISTRLDTWDEHRSEEDDSSESDMERCWKRKSIMMEAGDCEYFVAKQDRPDDGLIMER
ncbi:hypothetical protein EK21DRAFT_61541 [Setomelanomma holmii]|uniref:Uncharacterized protein n=1 Tax=Setomelanomma holmii TaxID=210430 RepID=A0A9P4HBU7_9PLEO|nr:hypothetical protein EK21DRAFT_61541 [Setomelanomma holmii]